AAQLGTVAPPLLRPPAQRSANLAAHLGAIAPPLASPATPVVPSHHRRAPCSAGNPVSHLRRTVSCDVTFDRQGRSSSPRQWPYQAWPRGPRRPRTRQRAAPCWSHATSGTPRPWTPAVSMSSPPAPWPPTATTRW